MQSPSQRALLVLDLQKEFLNPPTGRCLLPLASSDAAKQPPFLESIGTLLPRFRALGGDIIWIRSESRERRDFTDPRAEETIFVVNDSDSEEYTDEEPEEGDSDFGKGVRQVPKLKGGKVGGKDGNGPTRPPLLTDAYLSIESQHPPVSKGTPASEWHEPVCEMMLLPPDREVTKSWYSAFKDTELLTILRGRLVTQLVIVGLMTNVDVLATAADAARHGFEVWVLEDCLGYRSQSAHDLALDILVSDFAAERMDSSALMKMWEKGRTKKGYVPSMGLGATGMSKEELSKVVEGLRSTALGLPDSANGDKKQETRKPSSIQTPAETAEPGERVQKGPLLRRSAAKSDRVERKPSLRRPGGVPGTAKAAKILAEAGAAEAKAKAETNAVVEKLAAVKIEEKSIAVVADEKPVQSAAVVGDDEPAHGEEKSTAIVADEERLQGEEKPTTVKTVEEPVEEKAATGPSGGKPTSKPRKFESKAPVLGVGDKLGDGDSFILYNILPDDLAGNVFERLKGEVAWRSMFHRGGEVPRLVAVEGEVAEDGSFPIYRHPSDESPPLLPFSPTVELIRQEVQKVLKHPINHALIQHYRHGGDYISQHSDKTLDIARGSKIVNVSLGAQRTMILQTKRDAMSKAPGAQDGKNDHDKGAKIGVKRDMQRIPMPHNSMFVLGLQTNKTWLHSIKQDKRAQSLKTEEELAYNGERISLTFRHIATFLSSDEQRIWGQGATAKRSEDAHPVINGSCDATEELVRAFGIENQRSDFDWEAYYGAGFDILHMHTPKPRILTSGTLDVATARLKICLYEKGVDFTEQILTPKQLPSLSTYSLHCESPVFLDVDRERTAMSDSLATIQYLEMYHTPSSSEGPWLLPMPTEERAKYALALNRLQEAERLFNSFRRAAEEEVAAQLAVWNSYLRPSSRYAAGDEFSLVDVAVYPVLHEIRKGRRYSLGENLEKYVRTLAERPSVKRTYITGTGDGPRADAEPIEADQGYATALQKGMEGVSLADKSG